MIKGFKKIKIGDIGEPCMCKRIMKNETNISAGIPFYKIGTFGQKPDAYISKDLFYEYKKKYSYPKKGDILISASGTIGRTVIFDGKPAYFQDSNIVWINNNETKVLNIYFKYLLSKIDWNVEGSTIKRLYNGLLKSTEIIIPENLSEQNKISKILINIDNLMDSLQKTIEKKEKIYNSLLNRLFGDKYYDIENNNQGKKIQLVELCSLITKQTGFDYTSSIKPKLLRNRGKKSLPMIQNKDFQDQTFNYSTDYYLSKDVAKKFPKLWLKEPCLLITIVGSIGNIGLFNAEQQVFCGGAIGLLKFNKLEDLKYAYYCMKSKVGQNQLQMNTKGSTQPTVTIEDIRKIWIPYYKSQEFRDKAVKMLEKIEEDLKKSQMKLEKYKKIKEGMMEDLLTGKVRLNYG